MSDDATDPMLGDAETQQSYLDGVLRQMQAEIDSRRDARRSAAATPAERSPVLVGADGFGGGNLAI